MPKLLIACFILMFFVDSVLAENDSSLPKGFVIAQKSVLCGPAEIVFQSLASKEINEKPLWVGTTENGSHVAVFVNQHTSAFTVVQFGEQMLCILAIGSSSQMFSNKQPGQK